ncbi:MAG: CHAT domain-containing tetratricopeptide repeat protein [Microscillaceae bacterium]|nr:CHAT domain-containing tetratricopeptide repeat protein [Microscillaceae bacterium]
MPLLLSAQAPQNPNKTNAQGKKEGKWTVYYDNAWNEITDKSRMSFYRVAEYQDGKTVGKVQDYFANGQIQMDAEQLISENPTIFHGAVNYYRDNGEFDHYEYYNQGKLDLNKIEEFYTDRLNKIGTENGTNSPIYFDFLNQIISIYYNAGAYLRVEPFMKEAAQIIGGALGEQHPAFATYEENLSNLYRELGSYAQSEKLLKNVLTIRKTSLGKDHKDYLIGLRNLADILYLKGDYQKAESYYSQVLPVIAKNIGENSIEYATSLNNFAELQSRLGNYPVAEDLYAKAAEIYKANMGPKHPNYATALNNQANLLASQKKYTQAEPIYLQSLAIIKESQGTEHPSYALTVNNLARLYAVQGDYAKALTLFEESLKLRRNLLGQNHPNYAQSLKNLGDLYGKMQKNQEAEQMLLESNRILKETLGENHPTFLEAQNTLAKFYIHQKNYLKAEPILKEINQKLFKQIETYFPFLSENEKEEFYNNQIKYHFEEFNSYALLRQAEYPAILGDMYNNQLLTKALLLNSSNKWKRRIKNSGDLKLIRDFDKWQTEKAYLSKLYHDGDKANKDEIKALEIQLNDDEKKLSLRSELFANIQDKKIVKWQEIRDSLKKGEAAIEVIRFRKYGLEKYIQVSQGGQTKQYPNYALTDTIYYAALVITQATTDHPDLVLMDNGLDLEGKYLKNYRNKIKYKSPDDLSYNYYWQPFKKALKGITKVYFSPEGVFNQISLSTLKNPTNNKFLFDEIDIQLVTNTKDIIIEKEKDDLNRYALLFGAPNYGLESEERSKLVRSSVERGTQQSDDFGLEEETEVYALNIERSNVSLSYLPGTKIEVESIAEMLQSRNWRLEVYTGDQALEDHLKNSFKPNILHIATHGFFEKDPNTKSGEQFLQNPLLRSGLMLTGAGHSLTKKKDTAEEGDDFSLNDTDESQKGSLEDGILTAYEAMSLNLDNTDIVVLSACETGLGEIQNGEGVYGLQRAFKVAGARTIVMSLWNVNDQSTQLLMRSFYKNWLTIGNKHEAFRKAQEELRSEYPDPYFWGAFVIVGE